MNTSLLLMHIAVLIGASVQSATGLGFALISGPVILMAVNAGSAVQVTIVLSLVVAAVLAPSIFRNASKPLLLRMALGTVAGLPIGIFVYLSVSVAALKLGAGLCVVATAVSVLKRLIGARQRPRRSSNRVIDVMAGAVSGAMSVCLAMPGPLVAARVAALGLTKDQIRSTSLTLFTFSYTAAIAFQAALAGVAEDTLWLTLSLMPTVLVGVYAGRKAIAWISERAFLWIIALILSATAAVLLASAVAGL